MISYHNKLGAVCRSASFGLSRELWLVQTGVFLNTFGWGAVLPFEVIYLHDGRGFGLTAAGLIVGTITGLAVVAAPLAGTVIDSVGARAVAALAGLALAVGYVGLACSRWFAVSLAAAAVAGIGNGALNPAQSTLLAALARPELRHRATAVSRVSTNLGFGIGGAVGGVVASVGLDGFLALFFVNAATYVIYVCVLLAVVDAEPRRAAQPGGYRQVLGDPAFRRLALANTAVIAVGWGVLPWVIPPYAQHELGVRPGSIGLMMLVNAGAVIACQVPIARLAEGRRRTIMMGTGAGAIALSLVVVLFARHVGGGAFAALLVAACGIGIGECFYTAALMPLVADIAPLELRGRYMAATGFSWWIGLALAPIVGLQLLSLSPAATFAASASLAAVAALSLLSLDRRLPEAARRTPRPVRDASIRGPRHSASASELLGG